MRSYSEKRRLGQRREFSLTVNQQAFALAIVARHVAQKSGWSFTISVMLVMFLPTSVMLTAHLAWGVSLRLLSRAAICQRHARGIAESFDAARMAFEVQSIRRTPIAMKHDTLWFALSLAWLAFLAIAMPVVLLWH